MQNLQHAEAKLSASGISLSAAAYAGMGVALGATYNVAFHNIRALKLPYHDVDGSDSGFYRIRYLEDLPGFNAQLAKPQRYSQEASTVNWVYLPKVEGLNWSAIANDATHPLIITEGELKAFCACLYGFTTIALGGVAVWQSKKQRIPLLSPLDQFVWKGRQVTVVFDSDAATNPNVADASVRLCKELLRLGAAPTVASLPASQDGSKQGLDDFLVAGHELREVLRETRSLALGDHLLEFNNKYAFIPKMDVVVSLSDGHLWKRESFVNGVCANVKVVEYTNTANGTQKREEIVVAKEWLSWTARRDVKAITYKPGAERVTLDDLFNGWRAWGCEPSSGSVELWHELLKFVFSEEPEHLQWFEQWCAYPIQHPGTKLHTAVVLWSPGQGVGKSLVGNTLGKIYGENYTCLNSALLRGTFNGWYQNRQFILGDEVTGSDKRSEADRLKSLITQETAWINSKGIPEFEVPDYVNWMMTSNHSNAFFMDNQDRRYSIFRLPIEPMPKEFYNAFVKWRDRQGGDSALFHHLRTLDLTGFDPTAPAPLTKSKMEMIDHGMSDIACFVQNFAFNLDRELARFAEFFQLTEVPDLITSKMLLQYYDRENSSRVTTNGVARELTKFGFRRLDLITTKVFGGARFNVMRHPGVWAAAKPEVIRDYIDHVYASQLPKKGKF